LSNENPDWDACFDSTVVTMHDLIFLRYPQYYKFIDRLFTTSKCNMHVADHIVAISEQTKKMTLLNITSIDPSENRAFSSNL